MSTIADFPAGPVFFLNANNVDGVLNDAVLHGADVSAWKDQGSAALDFVPIPPGGNTDADVERMSPILKKGPTEESVSFDGSYNILTAVGSKSAFKFFHTTGIFDLLIVLRRRAVTPEASGARRLFGSLEDPTTQRGLLVTLGDSTTIEGAVGVHLGGDTGRIVSFQSSVLTPFAKPRGIFIRGDGTKLQITDDDFYRWQEALFVGGTVGGTNDAHFDYSIGGANPNQVYPLLTQFDGMIVAGWDRNLTPPELLKVRAAVISQIGPNS